MIDREAAGERKDNSGANQARSNRDKRPVGWRRDAMTKILLVQGANLTFLGRREPDIYGTTTPAELDARLQRHAQEHGYHLEIFYTNVEGEAINRIYQAVDEGVNGLVMNPAEFTYAGYALTDCINRLRKKAGSIPLAAYVECRKPQNIVDHRGFSATC
jgi:3-dehydroquinate dehydratase